MWMFYLARICNHCDHPACLAACPRKAIYKRDEDGIVLVDQERCRGYQECAPGLALQEDLLQPHQPASEKCIGCYPGGAGRGGPLRGVLHRQDPPARLPQHRRPAGAADNPLDYLVKIRKLALPLYPQSGTGPNVTTSHGARPRRLPRAALRPGVAQAKRLYRSLGEDPQLLAALLLFGASQRIITRFERRDKEVIGWDVDGRESRACRSPSRSTSASITTSSAACTGTTRPRRCGCR